MLTPPLFGWEGVRIDMLNPVTLPGARAYGQFLPGAGQRCEPGGIAE